MLVDLGRFKIHRKKFIEVSQRLRELGMSNAKNPIVALGYIFGAEAALSFCEAAGTADFEDIRIGYNSKNSYYHVTCLISGKKEKIYKFQEENNAWAQIKD